MAEETENPGFSRLTELLQGSYLRKGVRTSVASKLEEVSIIPLNPDTTGTEEVREISLRCSWGKKRRSLVGRGVVLTVTTWYSFLTADRGSVAGGKKTLPGAQSRPL